MSILQSIILGIIQGLTEFLPISSSGHLAIIPYLFGWPNPPFSFLVLVQVASLVAVITYYWNDILDISRAFIFALRQRKLFMTQESSLAVYIILATIPAGIAGLFLKDLVETAFKTPLAIAVFFLITAGLLALAEKFGRRFKSLKDIHSKQALIIGFFQALAIFPGLSRSGSTISGGMLQGLERPSAARFTFLLAIPILFAAGFLEIFDLLNAPGSSLFIMYIPGLIASGVVSYLSIRWLIRYLTNHSLYIFSLYCLFMGVLILLFQQF